MAQSSPEKVPEAVFHAAGIGDIETVNAWLRTAPDVNAEDKYGRPLLFWVANGTMYNDAKHVDLARKLLALGADVNSKYRQNEVSVLHCASCGIGPQAPEMVRLLLLNGADVNARTSLGGWTPMGYFSVYARSYVIENDDVPINQRAPRGGLLVICKLLLHAGASIDDVVEPTDWAPDPSMEAWLQNKQPGDDEEWLAVKRLVADVRAAGGTYRAYLHEHRKQLLTLRCLATKKGRATTTDPVMNFLVQLGDNGVIWKVLSFWPPPP